jgi:integrase
MGLGAVSAVSLAAAREKAAECRRLRVEGTDPIAARNTRRAKARLAAAKGITFDQCAAAYIAAHEAGWRHPKHRQQWRNTIATYVGPIFGAVPVQDVDVALVMQALEPIWSSKPETASRVRSCIEAILDWAKVREYRAGENPARWRNHLAKLLPKRSKVRNVTHFAALPYNEVAAFISDLRARQGVAARALEFAIMTASRTNEVLGATWSEIDLQARQWRISANRMKSGREHRVPLSEPAIAILRHMNDVRRSAYVFPGDPREKLSNMAFLMLLRRMKRSDVTPHGFRSSFRDWVAECTDFSSEVAEAALAHVVGDKTEGAYRRSDLFERRRRLMDAWAEHCTNTLSSGDIVALTRAARALTAA